MQRQTGPECGVAHWCAYEHMYVPSDARPTNTCKSDGPGRDRTCDLGIKSPLLYRLSYRPAYFRVWGKGTQKAPPSRSVKRRSSVATIFRLRSIPAAVP